MLGHTHSHMWLCWPLVLGGLLEGRQGPQGLEGLSGGKG